MSKFAALNFQKQAIDELTETFKKLWSNTDTQRPLLFESPTGSGKTFMMCHFINGMNRQPNWDDDKAYIWITMNDKLAMQSKDKFKEYFFPNIENDLMTVEDFNEGKLKKNAILFMNWQKVVSKAAENRKLRRPDNETMYKESGYYFEDIIENTKAEGREIVLIVDESHEKDTKLAYDTVTNVINPKVIMYVSATPKDEQIPNTRMVRENKAGHVYVKREDVIAEGLIKERIISQTEEDLSRYTEGDSDEILLDLAMDKKRELNAEFQKLGKNINPLVLIQLPNDDNKLKEANQPTKETIVTSYLAKKGISKDKIACWFDGRSENMDKITQNDSEIDFMIFKQAAGTGWDCPRAHILVMFREIKKSGFLTQVIGRILRMPEPHLKNDYKNSPVLKTGYLFTNYKRNEVVIPDQSSSNKPYVFTSKRKEDITNIELKSDFVSRIDYGDLSNAAEFQKSFIKSFNTFFNIDNELDMMEQRRIKIAAKNIDLNPHLNNQIIVNAVFSDYDKLNLDYAKQGKDVSMALSANDIEKMFNYACFQLLGEQTEADARISNTARSWSPLKSAFRVWFQQNLDNNSQLYYKILLYDLQQNGSSVFRQALTKALKEYRPILKELIEKRKKAQEEKEAPTFTIQKEYAFTEDYEKTETNLCALSDFYIFKDYRGKENEMSFVKYLESKTNTIDWWFKNGSSGKESYCFKYKNTSTQEESLFYPDWIIRFKDGTIGIFDTKGGQTATNTEGRAEALAKKLKTLNEQGVKAVGGIVLLENAQWYYNDSESYDYVKGKLNEDWKLMERLL